MSGSQGRGDRNGLLSVQTRRVIFWKESKSLWCFQPSQEETFDCLVEWWVPCCCSQHRSLMSNLRENIDLSFFSTSCCTQMWPSFFPCFSQGSGLGDGELDENQPPLLYWTEGRVGVTLKSLCPTGPDSWRSTGNTCLIGDSKRNSHCGKNKTDGWLGWQWRGWGFTCTIRSCWWDVIQGSHFLLTLLLTFYLPLDLPSGRSSPWLMLEGSQREQHLLIMVSYLHLHKWKENQQSNISMKCASGSAMEFRRFDHQYSTGHLNHFLFSFYCRPSFVKKRTTAICLSVFRCKKCNKMGMCCFYSLERSKSSTAMHYLPAKILQCQWVCKSIF